MKLSLFILAFLTGSLSIFAQNLMSPTEFLGEEYGKQFTEHHRLVDYFQHIAEVSPKVTLKKYGETNEGRPLYIAIITSEENQKDIEDIRLTNLQNIGLAVKSPSKTIEKSIVWLSYSVHGNEAGGAESSMTVVHKLCSNDKEINSWLDETVVIIDPSLNPDGYSRYSHWVKGASGTKLHPELTDAEHMEPWPGGRVNHYLFDLNRDWAWQTQVETQQRIVQYNQWMPHVHADLHEMGFDDHYYFAPAAEPFHKTITDWQREFQFKVGKNHASYFDENGWLYFTREIFDLLYPSYGDTYPIFNGSIGMTYEQAGHGMSGRSIRLGNGKDLVLQDRIDHHTTTSLSTIEVSAKNRADVVQNFKNYFQQSQENPVGNYKYYLVKKGELSSKFAELLQNNGIEFSYVIDDTSVNGYRFFEEKNAKSKAEKGDLYISTFQPKSTLLQVFMEERPVLADSVTYDITSWNIPLAYQLDAIGFTTKPNLSVSESKPANTSKNSVGTYGTAVRWNSDFDAKVFLSRAIMAGINVKTVQRNIKLGDISLNRGDLVMLNFDQKNYNDVKAEIQRLASDLAIETLPITTGFTDNGADLGGTSLTKITKPKVLTFFGTDVDPNSYGQVWNYFENIIDYPLSRVDLNNFSRVDLSDFNTIILPDGYYNLSKVQTDQLASWVDAGGKLIAIAGALRNLKNDKFTLGAPEDEEAEAKIKEANKLQKKRNQMRSFEGAERRSIAGSIPGAIFRTEIDSTHPLCYGLKKYYSLKNSSEKYPLLDGNTYNPVRIPTNYTSYGFIGSEIKNNFNDTFVFSVQNKGAGSVVYMVDNPLFRAFWKSGEIIFANALFQVQ